VSTVRVGVTVDDFLNRLIMWLLREREEGGLSPGLLFRFCVSTLNVLLGLTWMGAPVWKAFVVATAVMLCLLARLSVRFLEPMATAVLLIGAGVWIGALPPAERWPDLASAALSWITQRYS